MSVDEGSNAQASRLSRAIGRLLDRRVGLLAGEPGRAAAMAHGMAIFALVLTLSYVAFYLTYDMAVFAALIAFNLGAALSHAISMLMAHLGRQLGASLLVLGTGVLQLVMSSGFLGWEAGLHLFLLLGGQLVFLVFTERQRALRWVWAPAALFAFLACQFLLPVSGAVVQMPTVVLNALFSINALLTSSMLFILAAMSHFRAERARRRAAELAARAEYLANTDVLTGLSNRRPVMERLEQLSSAPGASYCLAIADLDHFKAINDRYGHSCGDRVLADVGAVLKASLRATDAVGRWGGEEFVFVIADAELPDAVATMERIRASVRDIKVACAGHDHPVTVSVGVTDGQYDGRPHLAIRRADDALYVSKAAGRDCVSVIEASAGQYAEDERVAEPRATEGASVHPSPSAS